MVLAGTGQADCLRAKRTHACLYHSVKPLPVPLGTNDSRQGKTKQGKLARPSALEELCSIRSHTDLWNTLGLKGCEKFLVLRCPHKGQFFTCWTDITSATADEDNDPQSAGA